MLGGPTRLGPRDCGRSSGRRQCRRCKGNAGQQKPLSSAKTAIAKRKTYRSWFSSCVRSVFTGLGGMLMERWGGINKTEIQRWMG